MQEIISVIVGFDCLCHPAIRVRFPDRTEKIKLLHQASYFFDVHYHRRFPVEKPHVDTPGAFCIAAFFVYFKDKLEIFFVLSLTFFAGWSCFYPGVVT